MQKLKRRHDLARFRYRLVLACCIIGREMEQKRECMSILAKCPECKGTGRVPKSVPFGANPKAYLTRADKMSTRICPECKGAGSIGIK